MSVTRITPWAINGPAAAYGFASSLSGTATNVPTGALIVTSVQAQSTTQPSVSDTAGNLYTVVLGESSSTKTSTWIAYCLSAVANTANIVKWQAGGAVLTGAQGATYATSSGTWSYDKKVSGLSAYATALSLSITTTGAGVIYGGFGEYYTGTDTWSVTGLTAVASQPGSSSGNGQMGCLLADDITTGGVTGLSVSVTDANGGYGGYIAGVVGSFVVNAGSTPIALTGGAQQLPSASGELSIAVPLHSVSLQAQSAAGGLTVQVPLSGHATATQQADGSLTVSVPLAASSVQAALARATLSLGVPLAGVGRQVQGAAASLSVHVTLAGEQLQQAIAAATLTNISAGDVALQGSSSQVQAAHASLSVGKSLQGASLAVSAGRGSLAVGVPLSGASVQAHRATGALGVSVSLHGQALQETLARATLANVAPIDLSGASAAQQSGAGTLLLQIHLSAESVQQVGAVATLGVSTIPTYVGNGRYYAAAPALAFYAAPFFSAYAAARPLSFYGSA